MPATMCGHRKHSTEVCCFLKVHNSIISPSQAEDKLRTARAAPDRDLSSADTGIGTLYHSGDSEWITHQAMFSLYTCAPDTRTEIHPSYCTLHLCSAHLTACLLISSSVPLQQCQVQVEISHGICCTMQKQMPSSFLPEAFSLQQ